MDYMSAIPKMDWTYLHKYVQKSKKTMSKELIDDMMTTSNEIENIN